jgi:hypothetical protein
MKVMASIFLLLGLVAFGLGIYMFIDKELLNQLDPTVRLVFSILLILYGGFRIMTAIGALRKKSAPTAAK